MAGDRLSFDTWMHVRIFTIAFGVPHIMEEDSTTNITFVVLKQFPRAGKRLIITYLERSDKIFFVV